MSENYLAKLKESKKEIINMCNNLQILPDSKIGKSLNLAIELIEKEIKEIEWLRNIYS